MCAGPTRMAYGVTPGGDHEQRRPVRISARCLDGGVSAGPPRAPASSGFVRHARHRNRAERFFRSDLLARPASNVSGGRIVRPSHSLSPPRATPSRNVATRPLRRSECRAGMQNRNHETHEAHVGVGQCPSAASAERRGAEASEPDRNLRLRALPEVGGRIALPRRIPEPRPAPPAFAKGYGATGRRLRRGKPTASPFGRPWVTGEPREDGAAAVALTPSLSLSPLAYDVRNPRSARRSWRCGVAGSPVPGTDDDSSGDRASGSRRFLGELPRSAAALTGGAAGSAARSRGRC
jgi:hypothetical protein